MFYTLDKVARSVRTNRSKSDKMNIWRYGNDIINIYMVSIKERNGLLHRERRNISIDNILLMSYGNNENHTCASRIYPLKIRSNRLEIDTIFDGTFSKIDYPILFTAIQGKCLNSF